MKAGFLLADLTCRLEYRPALDYQSLSPRVRGHFVRMGARRHTLLVALLSLFAGRAFALHSYTPKRPAARKSSKHHLRHLRWNPMFRPSHDSLLRQNEEIDRLDLPRIQDDDELDALKATEALVPIRT